MDNKQLFTAMDKVLPFKKEAYRFSPRQFCHANTWRAIGKSGPESVTGMGMFMPLFAYMASKERPGERLASFAPEVIGVGTGFLLSPVATAALTLIPGFGALPVGIRSFIGMTVGNIALNQPLMNRMGNFIRQANHYTNKQRSLEMGGGYRDSQNAAIARQAAMQEMSSSFGSKRRYLGNEALLLHG